MTFSLLTPSGRALLSLTALIAACQVGGADRLPDASLNLRLAAPIATWDEAIPLGNGLMGGLLWGEDNRIRLSLDRGDLWDERPAPGDPLSTFTYARMVKLAEEGRNDEIRRIADTLAYDQKHPTKIPAGRLEIVLDPSQQLESFELNLATAEGFARFTNGARLDLLFAAIEPGPDAWPPARPFRPHPVALMRIPGPEPKQLDLLPPASVKQLGYPAPRIGATDGLDWFEQDTADGGSFCVAVGRRRVGDATLLAITVATRAEGKSPRDVAAARIESALEASYESLRRAHAAWWAQFWSQSQVHVPEPDILRHYYLVQYFYGAASRRFAPPMPLQGVWTADAGTLPPWKGDYHHDLNTQMTYMGYQTAGRFDAGACFLDFLLERRPAFERFARDFLGTPGLNVPGVMTLAGQPLGGWAQYSLSPTAAGWLAHLFYLHWRYGAERDPAFEQAAYS
ncbi:MAG TPA: glycoside hydrolase N-terminal domain-containing protein [Verrucomicrobiota bacterium]|nr:glycoside hydrolase N-terminal domain-containing protein [Verrucomicrobiota bacterium]